MATEKRYYWLKLVDDFFASKEMKKLRKIAGGDTYAIVYMKLMLRAVKTGGVLEYTGIEDTFAAELALDIDEEPDNVQVTLNYLLSCGLAAMPTDTELLLIYVSEHTGSETAGAQRVRAHRERKALVSLALQNPSSSAPVTPVLQSYAQALQCNTDVTQMLRRERDRERDREREDIEKIIFADKPQTKTKFSKPSVDDIAAYCQERNNGVDAQHFFDYYEANGWKVGKNPMKDWKAAVRTWERNEKSGKASPAYYDPDANMRVV